MYIELGTCTCSMLSGCRRQMHGKQDKKVMKVLYARISHILVNGGHILDDECAQELCKSDYATAVCFSRQKHHLSD